MTENAPVPTSPQTVASASSAKQTPSETSPKTTAPNAVVGATEVTRRNFLWLGWSALVAFLGASAAATARFFFPNVIYEPSQKFNAGPADSYAEGVDTRLLNEQRVWIIRNQFGFYALWARCTHLGCTPNWFQDQNRFRCPCHGSNFNPDGDVIAGPAPQALWRCAVELASTGDLIIDKAVLEDRPGLREKEPFFLKYNA